MPAVGGVVVVLLVVALLAREAWSVGALSIDGRGRRVLDTTIVGLTAVFVAVVVVHLVTIT